MGGCHTNVFLCIISSVLAIFAKHYFDHAWERSSTHVLQPRALESKLGDHIIMEITEASPILLDSIDGLRDAVQSACVKANLTIIAVKTHKFAPQVHNERTHIGTSTNANTNAQTHTHAQRHADKRTNTRSNTRARKYVAKNAIPCTSHVRACLHTSILVVHARKC